MADQRRTSSSSLSLPLSPSTRDSDLPILLPDEILTSIALKMCKHNLSSAGNFMLSNHGSEIILNDYFRQSVDLSAFLANPCLCDQSTFFGSSFNANNPQALYLMSLEYVCVYEETEYGLSVLERSTDDRAIILMALASPCMGNPMGGLEILNDKLHNWIGNIDDVHDMAQEIELTVIKFTHDRHGKDALFQFLLTEGVRDYDAYLVINSLIHEALDMSTITSQPFSGNVFLKLYVHISENVILTSVKSAKEEDYYILNFPEDHASDKANNILNSPGADTQVREDNEGLQCPICLEVNFLDENIVTLPCHHKFGRSCINRWLGINNVCPVCRFELIANN